MSSGGDFIGVAHLDLPGLACACEGTRGQRAQDYLYKKEEPHAGMLVFSHFSGFYAAQCRPHTPISC